MPWSIDTLIVAGRFDSAGGKPSGYARKLFSPDHLISPSAGFSCLGNIIDVFNGGTLDDLKGVLKLLPQYHIVFWFADVPNEEPKFVAEIKNINPRCILITSKNNIEGKYSFLELINRALNVKANLCVEFTKDMQNLVQGRVFDPLGNQFNKLTDIQHVRSALQNRISELLTFTRSESIQVGDEIPMDNNESDFLEIARKHAENLHSHSLETTRFVGNLSFRCLHGFPSYRGQENLIYVSRRNIDKRGIDHTGMIAVDLYSGSPVKYYGPRKPSVDTPVQVKLYRVFPRIRYMFHAHAYLPEAPFTNRVIPCGALEEADELISMFPDRYASKIFVNLKGHGCLIMADSLDPIRRAEFIARNIPEQLSLDIEA